VTPTVLPIAKARIEEEFASGALNVHVMAQHDASRIVMLMPLSPLTYRDYAPGELIENAPVFQLRHHDAQVLFDALWEHGLRPTKAESTDANHLGVQAELATALREHITDLRKVAGLAPRTADQPAQPPQF
jgi:hypothetical protein